MRLDAKWESLLHLMRKTILLMPTDPSSELQYPHWTYTRADARSQRDSSEPLPTTTGLFRPNLVEAVMLTSAYLRSSRTLANAVISTVL